MLKSIATSTEAKTHDKSTRYDFSKVFQDIPALNNEVNEKIRKYEECQAKHMVKAASIRSR